MVKLDTTLKPAARAKLDNLLANGAAGEPATETFAVAARRIVSNSSIATASERLSRLERLAFPDIGGMPVTALKASHIYGVLESAAAAGLSRTTVGHLKNDIASVLRVLHSREVITENPASRVALKDIAAKHDGRPRVVLSDAEFAALVRWPDLDPVLRALCMTSRYLGGARTSDLHALDWNQVDTATWAHARVTRPKTTSTTLLALPDDLVPVLKAHWARSGRPARGPLFPRQRGARAGERSGKRSYARDLRKALWAAGVRRGATIEACPLQTDTATTRRADFHSFRRAFATGLAMAGMNNQQAMALAGHRSPATHQRYVALVGVLQTPAGALPRLDE